MSRPPVPPMPEVRTPTTKIIADTTDNSTLPKAVILAIERGWSVIPVRRDKTPFLNGWKQYQTKRATLEEAEEWQAKFEPPAWAVITGKISDLVVLDFDGATGRKTLKRLGLAPHLRTGSGGFHCYFYHPGWRVPTLNGTTKRALGEAYPGLDIRADGGYAIFSGLNSSGSYQKLRPRTPDDLSLLPKELRKLLGLQVSGTRGTNTPAGTVAFKKKSFLLDQALKMIVTRGRNNSGFWLACQLRDNNYDLDVAAKVMRDYADGVPETNQKGQAEPYTRAEALASLGQAYDRPPREEFDEPYFATDEGISWRKPGKDGEVVVPLTNFRAQIVADVVTDDGVEIQRKFEIAAFLDGKEITVTIPARDFPTMSWVLDALGPRAVIYAGFGTKDHCRTAIQLLSTKIRRHTIYTHTGWRKIGGDYCYLHAGGAIGPSGNRDDIEVSLPRSLANFKLPDPPSDAELQTAVRASLSILQLGPSRIMIPLFGYIWRAAVGTCDFSEHLTGPTGTFKTCLACLAEQHFGAGFDRLHPPAAWISTENSLEALQFTVKDGILLIDDFNPRGTKYDIERYHQKADRVLRGQGNNSGRGRMRSDSSLRETKNPRGATLSTGEDTPKGESLKARLWVLEIARGTIDEERLTACQEQAGTGLYCQAMAGFLKWLAPRYELIIKELPIRVARWRENATRSNQHRRIPENIANLMVGLKLFLRFCAEESILSDDEIETWLATSWEAIGRAAADQVRDQRSDEPGQRFLDLLSAALVSGEAHLKYARDGRSAGEALGRCIGWIDQEYVLLEPNVSFAEAQRMASQQGEVLPVTKNTLWKRLKDKGRLALCEKGRNQMKWDICGNERRVICLRASALRIGESE